MPSLAAGRDQFPSQSGYSILAQKVTLQLAIVAPYTAQTCIVFFERYHPRASKSSRARMKIFASCHNNWNSLLILAENICV